MPRTRGPRPGRENYIEWLLGIAYQLWTCGGDAIELSYRRSLYGGIDFGLGPWSMRADLVLGFELHKWARPVPGVDLHTLARFATELTAGWHASLDGQDWRAFEVGLSLQAPYFGGVFGRVGWQTRPETGVTGVLGVQVNGAVVAGGLLVVALLVYAVPVFAGVQPD
ncbi:MAG: hypothetical protein ACRDGN_01235 [bacterium]